MANDQLALDATVTELQAAFNAQKQRTQTAIDGLNATIADLQNHPSGGDFSNEIASLQGVIDGLNAETPAGGDQNTTGTTDTTTTDGQ